MVFLRRNFERTDFEITSGVRIDAAYMNLCLRDVDAMTLNANDTTNDTNDGKKETPTSKYPK